MRILTAERRSRLRVLLANLAEGQREFEEISRLDAQIRIDYHGRFLIELVQNAIDPAQQAGIDDAHLLVIRTQEHLAILNQGAPFDEGGLKALLSLGLSTKRPDDAIGNKGVGFKSVFEVADLAEVFGVEVHGATLATTPGLRLALSCSQASEHPGLVDEALHIAEDGDSLASIEERTRTSAAEAIREALGSSPGWRYPIERTAVDWNVRCRELGLSPRDLEKYQTAVVLHLRDDRQDRVERALEEFTGANDEVHLFLPGLACLEVRRGDGRVLLLREELIREPHQGITVRQLTTMVNGVPLQKRSFWVMESSIGGEQVEQAARLLPGPGWASVTRAVVRVALPVGPLDEEFSADGRYYVGLPSRDPTGSPFRVDARFHATLSRTSLDRVDNPYNSLLDRAAADLAADLLRLLRDAPDHEPFLVEPAIARRMVTLGLLTAGRAGFGESVRACQESRLCWLDPASVSFQ